MNLKDYEHKIEKRREKILELEVEINDIELQICDYKYDHCKYHEGNKCEYDDSFEDELDCHVCNIFEEREK